MCIIKTHPNELQDPQFGLHLIPMNDSHLPLLYLWNQKSEVLYWCEADDVDVMSEEDMRGMYQYISQSAYMFMIEWNGTLVGECWLQDMNLPQLIHKHSGKNIKRMDISIFEPDCWGKGIGQSINRLLVRFGFEQCQADCIYAITEDYNIRAQKCLEKSGFVLDEKMDHQETKKGRADYCYVIHNL